MEELLNDLEGLDQLLAAGDAEAARMKLNEMISDIVAKNGDPDPEG